MFLFTVQLTDVRLYPGIQIANCKLSRRDIPAIHNKEMSQL